MAIPCVFLSLQLKYCKHVRSTPGRFIPILRRTEAEIQPQAKQKRGPGAGKTNCEYDKYDMLYMHNAQCTVDVHRNGGGACKTEEQGKTGAEGTRIRIGRDKGGVTRILGGGGGHMVQIARTGAAGEDHGDSHGVS